MAASITVALITFAISERERVHTTSSADEGGVFKKAGERSQGCVKRLCEGRGSKKQKSMQSSLKHSPSLSRSRSPSRVCHIRFSYVILICFWPPKPKPPSEPPSHARLSTPVAPDLPGARARRLGRFLPDEDDVSISYAVNGDSLSSKCHAAIHFLIGTIARLQ